MTPLSLGYVFVAGMIAALIALGKRNQKQGWRKRRGHWLEVQSTSAIKAFVARRESPVGAAHLVSDASLAHMDDLRRLNQSLVAHGELQERAVVAEKDLAKSR